MNREVFKQKIKDHKILVVLFGLATIAIGVGFYYNLFRENKQTFHYTFRNGPNKEFNLFFQRVSDQPEEKNVVAEIFNFKYGSIVSLKDNKAYYILNSPYSETDQIYEYDFSSKEGRILYENKDNFIINDIYLLNNNLLILTNSKLMSLNLQNQSMSQIIETNFTETKINEFINHKEGEIILGFDGCKFTKEKCKYEGDKPVMIVNLNFKSSEKSLLENLDSKYLEINEFFGTNKVYRRGILRKYDKDEGNKNYNFRIFTQS